MLQLNLYRKRNQNASEEKGTDRLMLSVREMRENDWPEVCRIYRQGMETNLATFEKEIPPYDVWNRNHLPFGRLVCEYENKTAGWTALTPFSGRRCFSGVAEVSIYISNGCKRMGVGTRLLFDLIEDAERNGIWMLQSQIMLNNEPSLALHRKCGFREVGYREKIAKDPRGNWRDMVLMEYRSSYV